MRGNVCLQLKKVQQTPVNLPCVPCFNNRSVKFWIFRQFSHEFLYNSLYIINIMSSDMHNADDTHWCSIRNNRIDLGQLRKKDILSLTESQWVDLGKAKVLIEQVDTGWHLFLEYWNCESIATEEYIYLTPSHMRDHHSFTVNSIWLSTLFHWPQLFYLLR